LTLHRNRRKLYLTVDDWSWTMPEDQKAVEQLAPVERRAAALEQVFEERNLIPSGYMEDSIRHAEEDWVPANGAKIVARAWTDPEFKRRLLADGKAAVGELGFGLPAHHRHLVVLENTPDLQNVICCTLCSCMAFTIIGLPPGWYKDFEYRSRVVRQSRTVLREMGLDLPDAVRIKVWDTTADTRYMVLPVQPPETVGWPEDKLAAVVTKESMICVARLEAQYR
jgi:nitrile hydratase